MELCGIPLARGEKKRTLLEIHAEFSLPVWMVCGEKEGPTLVVTAGVHGCEFVGIQTARKFYEDIDTSSFCGQLILVPMVNPSGFYQGEKQIVPEDGKNLNRVFPGNKDGSLSQKIAYAIEQYLYPCADFLLDLHGGDINEALIPLVFFPVTVSEEIRKQAEGAAMHLPVPYRVRSTSRNGLYSHGAQCGVPALLLEIGSGGRWNDEEISLCEESLRRLMGYLGMGKETSLNTSQKEGVEGFYEEAHDSGFWHPFVKAGQEVVQGAKLGELRNLDGCLLKEYTAKVDGVVWYYTTTLGVKRGDSLLAYGRCE